jgi:hypothetical protein
MYICIFTLDAANVTRLGNALSHGLVVLIEFQLIQYLVAGRKKFGLFALQKILLMLFGPIGEQHAAAGGDLECPCRMLVGTNLAQKSEADLGTRERTSVVVAIDFIALIGTRNQIVAMKTERRIAGELA